MKSLLSPSHTCTVQKQISNKGAQLVPIGNPTFFSIMLRAKSDINIVQKINKSAMVT